MLTENFNFTEFLNTNLPSLIPAAIIMAIFIGVYIAWHFFISSMLLRLINKMNMPWAGNFLSAFKKPVSVILIVTGVFGALGTIPVFQSYVKGGFLSDIYRLFLICAVSWGLIKAKGIVEFAFSSLRSGGRNETLVIFFTRIYCALIVVFAFLMALSDLGFNVTGLLTGLGLGSLTFALAAQDAASNFFGGFIIITERPFEVGDWITADVIEGSVEDITFRSTKVRTLTGTLTIVPNSKLSGGAITNWTKLEHRNSRFTLNLMYSTPKATVKAVSDRVQKMLMEHKDVESETVEVRLSDFADSSIDLFITFYVSAIKIADFRAIMDDINYKIMDIMAEEKASFAFPSRSIYFENSPYLPSEQK